MSEMVSAASAQHPLPTTTALAKKYRSQMEPPLSACSQSCQAESIPYLSVRLVQCHGSPNPARQGDPR